MRFSHRKRIIFFTGRVHPGESPASHMLNGALDIICDPNNEQGKILRKHFVFKVIPIINPDGVSRGYYRLDTMAYNLNRFYLNPNRVSLFDIMK
jgi:cytosolic carboxypeptidase protein 5